MQSELYTQYGDCVIPRGTLLYRAGPLGGHGAYFALHPIAAHNFGGGPAHTPVKWKVKQEIRLLLAVKHLNKMGHAIPAIEDLYRKLVGPLNDLDDLDIKGRNETARNQFLGAIQKVGLQGWLSPLENEYALEVFFLPELYPNLRETGICEGKREMRNTLRDIKVNPSSQFLKASLKHLTPSCLEYLKSNRELIKEYWYSLLHKIFINGLIVGPK